MTSQPDDCPRSLSKLRHGQSYLCSLESCSQTPEISSALTRVAASVLNCCIELHSHPTPTPHTPLPLFFSFSPLSLSLENSDLHLSYFAEFVCCEVLDSNTCCFSLSRCIFSLPQLFVFLFDVLSVAVCHQVQTCKKADLCLNLYPCVIKYCLIIIIIISLFLHVNVI